MTVVAAVLIGASASTEAEASKGKKQPRYWGSVTASGEWQQFTECGDYSYTSRWQLEGLYDRTRLEPAGELNMSMGGATGGIDWTLDDVCNGSVEMGNCSIALDEPNFILPVFLDKAPRGLTVDFQLSLVTVGCDARVAPYGVGFEAVDRVTKEPQGFISSKSIGKKVINVPISGHDSGTDAGQTFSGQMSGTLKLTRRKPLQELPF